MSSDDAQEKSQEATPKKKEDSKKKGVVVRSKELNTVVLLLLSSGMILFSGNLIVEKFSEIMRKSFILEREVIFDVSFLVQYLKDIVLDGFYLLIPFAVILFFATLVSGSVLGGIQLNLGSLKPKLERIDPIKGIKKIISIKGLMELVKAMLKFVIIVSFSLLFIYFNYENILSLSFKSFNTSIVEAFEIIAFGFVSISASTIIIALVDTPFQIWNHNKQLKMSMQEVKDEMKNTDGNPEIKSRIRRVQQEMARKRMMQAVPDADVIITNPEHYAVALKYNKESSGAPVLLAKGCDFIAQQIKAVAISHEIEVVELPPLARAIYHTTKLNKEIPSELYVAIAQVLAYVYQIDNSKKGLCKRPKKLKEIVIPENMKY